MLITRPSTRGPLAYYRDGPWHLRPLERVPWCRAASEPSPTLLSDALSGLERRVPRFGRRHRTSCGEFRDGRGWCGSWKERRLATRRALLPLIPSGSDPITWCGPWCACGVPGGSRKIPRVLHRRTPRNTREERVRRILRRARVGWPLARASDNALKCGGPKTGLRLPRDGTAERCLCWRWGERRGTGVLARSPSMECFRRPRGPIDPSSGYRS